MLGIVLGLAGCSGPRQSVEAGGFLLSTPPQNTITLWGHAAVYVDIDGFGIVTDPVFDDDYGLVHERTIPAPPPSAYASARVVLISHAHYDHLSPKTLATFPKTTTILCPPLSAVELVHLDQTVRVMKPGDRFEFPGGYIVAVPARHPGGKLSLKARADGGALGYVIHTRHGTIYYSGDTEYFPGFKEIGSAHQPDIAIMNINHHLQSPDAVKAIVDLGAPLVIPSHFGAYTGSGEARSRESRRELSETLGKSFFEMKIGKSVGLAVLKNLRNESAGSAVSND